MAAAPVSSPWAKPKAWADEVEDHDNQNDHHQQQVTSDFPSLAAAAAKPKKKKAQPISLADFSKYGGPKPSQATNYADNEILMDLPTGPRQRTAEELERGGRGGLGGGFRSYGGNRNSGGGDDSSNSRWGSSRVSDEPRRNGSFNRDSNREIMPSRADEIDDWAAAKKSTVNNNGYDRRDYNNNRDNREKGGFFDNQSRADESDNWAAAKKSSTVSNGYDRMDYNNRDNREKGGFFDSQSRADESDNWVSKKSFVPSEGRRFERERKVGFGFNGGAESDNWNRKKVEVNVGGGGEKNEVLSERPRLNLKPRTVPLSDGSGEEGGVGVGNGEKAKAKGVNPFGAARPREEVLAEKGQDWKKMDEQFEAVKIKEHVEKKEGFGFGNGRASLPDEATDGSWRKPVSDDDARPTSAEESEDVHVEETEGL